MAAFGAVLLASSALSLGVGDDIPFRVSIQAGYGDGKTDFADANYFGTYFGAGVDWSWGLGASKRFAFGLGLDAIQSIGSQGNRVGIVTAGPDFSWRGDFLLLRVAGQTGVGWSRREICHPQCAVSNPSALAFVISVEILGRVTKDFSVGVSWRPTSLVGYVLYSDPPPTISGNFFGVVAAYTWNRSVSAVR